MINDNELEHILKQALRPDISDEEILVKKSLSASNGRKFTMKKHQILHRTIAAAACLALIFGIGYKFNQKPLKTLAPNTATADDLNSFVVKVNAPESAKIMQNTAADKKAAAKHSFNLNCFFKAHPPQSGFITNIFYHTFLIKGIQKSKKSKAIALLFI